MVASAPTRLEMRLPRLPNLDLVGANARHANYGAQLRAKAVEKHDWMEVIRAVRPTRFENGAYYNAPVIFRCTLHFPTLTRRDFDNAVVALKVLVDLLQPFRKTRKYTRRGNRPYWQETGMLGWFADDKLIEWPWDLHASYRSPTAPMTEISVEPADGLEQRRLV